MMQVVDQGGDDMQANLPSSSSKSESSSSSLGCVVDWFCGGSEGGAGVVAGAGSLSPEPDGVAIMGICREGEGFVE